jgi:leukotriene-A4 hydrolase
VSGILNGDDFRKIEAQLGNNSLDSAMATIGLNNSWSSINPVLMGENPDESFSEVPYEKGFLLISYLESVVGASAF